MSHFCLYRRSPVFLFAIMLPALILIGCGGDDLSKPPGEIAARLAKAREKAKSEQQGSEPAAPPQKVAPADSTQPQVADQSTPVASAGSGNASPQSSDAGGSDTKIADKTMADSSVAGSTAAQSENASEPPLPSEPTNLLADLTRPAPADSPDKAAAAEGSASKGAASKGSAGKDDAVVTAGGKPVGEIRKQQEKDESTAKAGKSLLEKLRSGGGEPDEKKSTTARRTAPTRRGALSRFGRFAIAAKTWLQLQNQLSKRFYVATTESGRRLAASSGQRSLGVLSTQIAIGNEERIFERTASSVIARTRDRQKTFTQPVRGLTGTIKSLELIEDGNVVVAGTKDGRVLARSAANLQDRDIYAQDLLAFQDEYRPPADISDQPIIVLRALSEALMLTITQDNVCSIWKTNELVRQPVSPLDMTESDVESPDVATFTPTPAAVVDTPDSRVLAVTVSASRALAALITIDETVTIFRTESGEVVDTLAAADFGDTQPVSAIIEEQQQRVTVGLADGRILSRSFGSAEPVNGTNDEGDPVDYETVFSPDLGDRSGAITAMAMTDDGKLLYVGRLDGSVTTFDRPRKQLLTSQSLHRGPVIEIRTTPAGVMTVGDERVAKLIDQPGLPATTKAVQFTLPKDEPLRREVIIEDENEAKQDRFTRPRNFNREVAKAANDEVSLVGIRPTDPTLAMYEHQLRVADTPESRFAVRNRIRSYHEDSGASSPKSMSTSGPEGLTLLREITTTLDYTARPLRRAVLAVSNDGTTVAVTQFFRNGQRRGAAPNQPVMVWDTMTGVPLRTWRRAPGVTRLNLDLSTGLIVPDPPSTQLNIYGGQIVENQFQQYMSSARSATGVLALGRVGVSGVAAPCIEISTDSAEQPATGVDAFEGVVTAMAWSPDGSSLFANVRDRNQIRMLQIDANTLTVMHELAVEPVTGQWDPAKTSIRSVLGATHIIPSASGTRLLTYGHYPEGYQLRIWKGSKGGWPQDKVTVITDKEPLIEEMMTDTPFAFVDNREAQIAVVGEKGIGVVGLRSGKVESTSEVPDFDGRRPVILLAVDGSKAYVGDQDGNIWTRTLRQLERRPESFKAHTGPITGIGMSPNGRYLVTAGQENAIRVWDLRGEPVAAAVSQNDGP